MLRTLGIGTARRPGSRRLDPMLTNVLQCDYVSGRRANGAGNGRDYRRWRNRFARVGAVAADALEFGDRRAAIECLCEVVCLEHAIALTGDGPVLGQGEMRGFDDPAQTILIDQHIPVGMRLSGSDGGQWQVTERGVASRILAEAGAPFFGVDRGISLDSLVDPPRIGTRRRITGTIQPPPFALNLDGMAPGQPTRFTFTQREQAVDLERGPDGWRVVRMVRSGAAIVDPVSHG